MTMGRVQRSSLYTSLLWAATGEGARWNMDHSAELSEFLQHTGQETSQTKPAHAPMPMHVAPRFGKMASMPVVFEEQGEDEKKVKVNIFWAVFASLLIPIFYIFYRWVRVRESGRPLPDGMVNFRNFRKSFVTTGSQNKWDDWMTLRFHDPDEEDRFAMGNANLICRRVRFLSLMLFICVVLHALIKVDWTKTFQHGAGNFWVSLFSVVSLILIINTMTRIEQFINLHQLEVLLIFWLSLIVLMSSFYFLHIFDFASEFERRLHDGEDNSRDLNLVIGFVIFVYYLSIHMPIRFMYTAPLCGILPFYYLIFTVIMELAMKNDLNHSRSACS